MKGPKPVWIFATKRLNQSSPRLAPDLVKFAVFSLSAAAGIRSLLVFFGSRNRGRGSRSWGQRLHQCLRTRIILVFRRRLQFFTTEAQYQRRRIALVGVEAQQRPFHGDAAIADAQEPAEVDNGGAHAAGGIGQHVDDAPEVLSLRALNPLAENGYYRHRH